MYKTMSTSQPGGDDGETLPCRWSAGALQPGTRYFGPFVQAWSIRETVEQRRCGCFRALARRFFRRARPRGVPACWDIDASALRRISPQDHRVLAERPPRLMAAVGPLPAPGRG